jgi:hypothetical protein
MRLECARWSRQPLHAGYNDCVLRPIFDPPYFYVGWLTLSLINAGLAQGKNRSGLLWFIVSVFFGPLTTLIIVLLPRG